MNQYEELGFIGRGAYGQCFLARNVVTQKKYVMKKISLQKGYSAEKLITESLVLKTLTGHPNICSYVDSFVHGKELCIIMDHYAGGDLQKKIDDKRRSRATFSLDTILDFLLQLCIGLKHIHAQNILHRDIKPSNIFITKANVLKIGDFGIAKVLKEESFAMTGIGTPYYLSPEKITKTPYGPKSDMWSLGCLLYEMCTLKVPFRGADHNSLYCKIIEKPTPLLPRKYGKYLQTILNGLLHKDPKRRPSAARILRTRVMQARLMFHSTRYQQKLVGKEINRYQFGQIPGQITPKNPDRSPPRNAREGRSKSEDSVVRAPISPPVVSPVGRRVDPSPPFPSERSPPVASVCPASPKARRAGSIPDKWQHGENSPPLARSPEQGVLQSPRYQRGDKSIQKNGKKSSSSADEAVEVLKRFQEHVDNQLVEAKAEGHQPEEKEARNEEQGESPQRAESPHRAGAQPPYPVGNENSSEAEKESKRRYVRMLSKKMTSCRSYLEAVLGPAIVCLAAGYVRKLHRSGVTSKEALLLKVVKRFFAKKDTWTWDMKCCYAEEIVDMCEAERRLLRLYDC